MCLSVTRFAFVTKGRASLSATLHYPRAIASTAFTDAYIYERARASTHVHLHNTWTERGPPADRRDVNFKANLISNEFLALAAHVSKYVRCTAHVNIKDL